MPNERTNETGSNTLKTNTTAHSTRTAAEHACVDCAHLCSERCATCARPVCATHGDTCLKCQEFDRLCGNESAGCESIRQPAAWSTGFWS